MYKKDVPLCCIVLSNVAVCFQKSCKVVQKGVDSDNVESLFYASSAARSLGSAHCKVSIYSVTFSSALQFKMGH